MKNISIIILSIVLFSCNPIKEDFIDPELYPYIQKFRYEAEIRGYGLPDKDLLVEFNDVPGYGRCKWKKNWAHIKIHPEKYKSISDSNKEYIVFHELGHGLLNRHHAQYADTITTMMTEDTYGMFKVYEDNRELFLDELFR